MEAPLLPGARRDRERTRANNIQRQSSITRLTSAQLGR